MPTFVTFSDVTKAYGSTVAVRRLSLEVGTGEVVGLLGPNGAGKSTTLYMLAGLVRPTSGTITVFGKDTRRNHLECARRMGVLVERPAFYNNLTARNNLRLQARLARQDVSINRALDLAGILHAAETKAGKLSQGMRQRLGLAQALLTEPELLILDEPASGLDVESTQEILRLLRRLADEARVTILFSSHQMREVEMLCDRVAILNQGKLVSCEKTDALLSYDMRCIEVLVEGAESAARKLSELLWVESVEAKPGRLTVKLAEPNAHQLNIFLVNAGYQVAGVIPRRRTLQEYFLKALNPKPPAEKSS